MNEPRRLLDEAGSDVERALLEAGAGYRCSLATRNRVMAGLGLFGSTGMVSVAGASVLGRWAAAGRLKLWAGFSAVGLVALIPLSYLLAPGDGATRSVPAVTTVLTVARPSFVETLRAPEPVSAFGLAADSDEEQASPAPLRASARVLDVRRAAARAPVRASARSLSLTDELEALDRVRTKLASGQPRKALALLEGYARAYPRGRLALEAEVLRIDALAKNGQSALARRRAEAFLLRHPKSVLAPRVRGYAGG